MAKKYYYNKTLMNFFHEEKTKTREGKKKKGVKLERPKNCPF
jgi:hypothetical protein